MQTYLPVNLLLKTCIMVNLVNDPILDGIVPKCIYVKYQYIWFNKVIIIYQIDYY